MSDYDSVPGLYQNKLLSRDEEKQLVKLMKSGSSSARDTLILANVRLVASIAKNYHTIPHQDAIGEGLKGLMCGIDHYDGSLNVRISTYVTWWIHNSLRSYEERTAMIHIPSFKRCLLYKIDRIARGQNLSEAEIAQKLSTETGQAYTAENIREYRSQREKSRLQSLDAKLLHIEPAVEPKQEATNLESFLGEAVTELLPRERYVIEMRFLANPVKKLQELGAEFGISRERVRQIEKIALDKLRRVLRLRE